MIDSPGHRDPTDEAERAARVGLAARLFASGMLRARRRAGQQPERGGAEVTGAPCAPPPAGPPPAGGRTKGKGNPVPPTPSQAARRLGTEHDAQDVGRLVRARKEPTSD
jgi:hypothetical protein